MNVYVALLNDAVLPETNINGVLDIFLRRYPNYFVDPLNNHINDKSNIDVLDIFDYYGNIDVSTASSVLETIYNSADGRPILLIGNFTSTLSLEIDNIIDKNNYANIVFISSAASAATLNKLKYGFSMYVNDRILTPLLYMILPTYDNVIVIYDGAYGESMYNSLIPYSTLIRPNDSINIIGYNYDNITSDDYSDINDTNNAVILMSFDSQSKMTDAINNTTINTIIQEIVDPFAKYNRDNIIYVTPNSPVYDLVNPIKEIGYFTSIQLTMYDSMLVGYHMKTTKYPFIDYNVDNMMDYLNILSVSTTYTYAYIRSLNFDKHNKCANGNRYDVISYSNELTNQDLQLYSKTDLGQVIRTPNNGTFKIEIYYYGNVADLNYMLNKMEISTCQYFTYTDNNNNKLYEKYNNQYIIEDINVGLYFETFQPISVTNNNYIKSLRIHKIIDPFTLQIPEINIKLDPYESLVSQ